MTNDIFILSIAVVLLLIGVNNLYKAQHLKKSGKPAQGIIFKNNYKHNAHSTGTYHPVVRFLTEDNIWVTEQLDYGTNPPRQVGAKINVLYDPENPKNFIENSAIHLTLLPPVLIFLGITGIIVGMLELLEVTEIFR